VTSSSPPTSTPCPFEDDVTISDRERDRLHAGVTRAFEAERRYRRKDGSVVWAAVKVTVRRGADGGVLYDIAVIDDTSRRRAAEKAMRERETRFKQLTDLSSDW
jgi:PAS domain S-box-containing protein